MRSFSSSVCVFSMGKYVSIFSFNDCINISMQELAGVSGNKCLRQNSLFEIKVISFYVFCVFNLLPFRFSLFGCRKNETFPPYAWKISLFLIQFKQFNFPLHSKPSGRDCMSAAGCFCYWALQSEGKWCCLICIFYNAF